MTTYIYMIVMMMTPQGMNTDVDFSSYHTFQTTSIERCLKAKKGLTNALKANDTNARVWCGEYAKPIDESREFTVYDLHRAIKLYE